MTKFTNVIVRRPAKSMVEGIKMCIRDRGTISWRT